MRVNEKRRPRKIDSGFSKPKSNLSKSLSGALLQSYKRLNWTNFLFQSFISLLFSFHSFLFYQLLQAGRGKFWDKFEAQRISLLLTGTLTKRFEPPIQLLDNVEQNFMIYQCGKDELFVNSHYRNSIWEQSVFLRYISGGTYALVRLLSAQKRVSGLYTN